MGDDMEKTRINKYGDIYLPFVYVALRRIFQRDADKLQPCAIQQKATVTRLNLKAKKRFIQTQVIC